MPTGVGVSHSLAAFLRGFGTQNRHALWNLDTHLTTL